MVDAADRSVKGEKLAGFLFQKIISSKNKLQKQCHGRTGATVMRQDEERKRKREKQKTEMDGQIETCFG